MLSLRQVLFIPMEVIASNKPLFRYRSLIPSTFNLSNDILLIIFDFVLNEVSFGQFNKYRGAWSFPRYRITRGILAQVCRRWWTVLSHGSQYWSVFGYTEQPANISLLKTWFERSRSHPLSFQIPHILLHRPSSDLHEPPREFVNLASDILPRCRRLFIYDSGQTLSGRFTLPAMPLLHELCIHYQGSGWHPIIAAHVPFLKILRLTNVSWHIPTSFYNITHLSLVKCDIPRFFEDALLTKLPLLASIELRAGSLHKQLSRVEPVICASLISIKMAVDDGAMELLDIMQAPALSRLELQGSSFYEDSRLLLRDYLSVRPNLLTFGCTFEFRMHELFTSLSNIQTLIYGPNYTLLPDCILLRSIVSCKEKGILPRLRVVHFFQHLSLLSIEELCDVHQLSVHITLPRSDSSKDFYSIDFRRHLQSRQLTILYT